MHQGLGGSIEHDNPKIVETSRRMFFKKITQNILLGLFMTITSLENENFQLGHTFE
jgi:hypothetical protein